MNITFYHQSRGYDDRGFLKYTNTPLKFDFWSKYDFQTLRNTSIYEITYNEYEYCFNVSATEIGGSDYNSKILERVILKVSTWSSSSWINNSNQIGHLSVSLFVLQRFIDLDDLENTLKPVFQQINHQNLMKNHKFYDYSFNL